MLKKNFYSTCKIRHCLAVLFFLFLYLQSNSQVCAGCTTVITSNTSANITIGPSDFVCIAPGVSATGNITLNGGKLCNEGTVSNLTLIQGYFYNHGEFSKPTGNLNITNAKNLWIECYGTSNFNLINSMNVDALTNTDSVMINVYKGAKFSIGKSLSMSKGYLKIRNALDKSGEFLPLQCYFNIGGQLNISNASLRILNNDYGIFNVTNAVNLEGKYNKTILNYGLFSCNNSFNISGNGQNQYNIQIENNGTFNITRHLNSAYNNGTVTINNNEYPVKPEPSFSIGRSLTISKANNAFNNKIVLTVEQDVFLENGSLTNTRNVYVNRDVEVKNGSLSNGNSFFIARDLLLTDNSAIVNNDYELRVGRLFSSKGTVNFGKKSFMVTKDFTHLNGGYIYGPADLLDSVDPANGNDSSNYALINITDFSDNNGNLRQHLILYDENFSGSGIALDNYHGNTVKLGMPPVIIGFRCFKYSVIANVILTSDNYGPVCVGTPINLQMNVINAFSGATIPVSNYLWNPGNITNTSNTFSYNVNRSTNFSVKSSFTNGCSITKSLSINTQACPLSVTGSIINYEDETAKGSINLTITGGQYPYELVWNNLKIPSNNEFYTSAIEHIPGIVIDSTRVFNELDSLRSIRTKMGLYPDIHSIAVYDSIPNDSVKIKAYIGEKLIWFSSPGIVISNCVIEPIINGNNISLFGTGACISVDSPSGEPKYSISQTAYQQDENNYFQFSVNGNDDRIAVGLRDATPDLSLNAEVADMASRTYFNFITHNTFEIYANFEKIYEGTYEIGDIFSLSTNPETNKIIYRKNSTLLTSYSLSLIKPDKGLLLKIVLMDNSSVSKVLSISNRPIGPPINICSPNLNLSSTNVSCDNENTGKVTASVPLGFVTPTNFVWNLPGGGTITDPGIVSGGVISSNLLNVPAGLYNVTFNYKDCFNNNVSVTKPIEIAFLPEWTNVTNSSIAPFNNSLIKNSGATGIFDAGASSINKISSTSSGSNWFETTVPNPPTGWCWEIYGLSSQDANINYTSINYGVVIGRTTSIYYFGIVNNGTFITPLIPSTISTPNPVIRFEKTGATVNIKVNNALAHSFSGVPSLDYLIDASLANFGSSVGSPRLSFGCTTPLQYAKLNNKIDGGYYNANGGKLYFTTDGEYSQINLKFNIYNNSNNIVMSNSSSPSINSVIQKLGDNRYILSNLSSLGSGYYILEIVNEKMEKVYLRFKV